MAVDTETVKPERKKKSLLEKYDIPINHLDYSYIRECEDAVEIERIVRILRSNEEGCYPELLKCAEDRLGILNPKNKLLRKTEPILTKKQLDPEVWKSLEEDLLNWKEEVENVESRLSNSEDILPPPNMYPDVRRPIGKMNTTSNETIVKKETSNRISSTDYKKWDMYDADCECLKLDLEEEKQKEEKKRKELEEKKKMEKEAQLSLEEAEIKLIASTADGLSQEERKILAVKEKNLGNEFYNTNRLDQALRHYTRSIYLNPTPVAYNNRAATYLKECRFSKALDDLNIVIEMDPENVKAHFRRALSYQHKNEFEKALDDILVVLKHEPRHLLARHVADQLREHYATMPKKHRVRVRDENNPSRVVVKEVTEEELKRDYKDIDYIEVNHLGLPRIMCNCNGKYTNDPILKSNDPIRFQHIRERYSERSVDKISEMERSSLSSKRVKPMGVGVADEPPPSSIISKRNKPLIEPTNPGQGAGALFGGAKRLEIVELEKIEEEDQSPNKQSLVSKPFGLDQNESMNALSSSTSCIVSDMRSVTKPKRTYFGGYIEEEDETNVAVIKPFNATENVDNKPLHTLKDEQMNFTANQKDSEKPDEFDFDLPSPIPTIGEGMSTYMPGIMAQEVNCDLGATSWDPVSLRYSGGFRALKNSPQSPLSNSSLNDEFSSDIDSDDDEFPDDENSSDQIVDIDQVEKLIDNDVDTISKDLFPHDTLLKCECGEGYKLRPIQFESKWTALENSSNSINERGKLIRLICPHRLSSVIGNTLNEPLLAGFIACLNYHFDVETEKEKILSYLESISSLERFRIIESFLTAKDKAVADELQMKLQSSSNKFEKTFS